MRKRLEDEERERKCKEKKEKIKQIEHEEGISKEVGNNTNRKESK